MPSLWDWIIIRSVISVMQKCQLLLRFGLQISGLRRASTDTITITRTRTNANARENLNVVCNVFFCFWKFLLAFFLNHTNTSYNTKQKCLQCLTSMLVKVIGWKPYKIRAPHDLIFKSVNLSTKPIDTLKYSIIDQI